MQKILLLIPSLANAGGTERMVHMLSGLLASAGHDVHQASFDPPGTARHFDSSTPFHPLGPVPRLPLPLRPLAYVLSAWRLRRLKRHLDIDTTISNLWGGDLISILSAGSDYKIALCHINIVGNRSNRMMLRLLPLVSVIYRRFNRVVAVSETLADELKKLYGLSADKITHIDNFSDRPQAAPLWHMDDGVKRFVWCGRFSHEKNIAGLLHAWARFVARRPGHQLVLVGDGPDHDQMQALARDLGLHIGRAPDDRSAQVVFAGRTPDPAAFMSGAHALVLSSRAEGLPMVVLEALALGIPVLAADCPSGGVRTALLGEGVCNPDRDDMETSPAGILLPVPVVDNVRSLALWDAALSAISADIRLHAACSRGALERAQLFSSSVALDKWQAVIERRDTGA